MIRPKYNPNDDKTVYKDVITCIILAIIIFCFSYFFLLPSYEKYTILNKACNNSKGGEYNILNKDGSKVECSLNTCIYETSKGKIAIRNCSKKK